MLIDLHHHLLWGLDDGASDREETRDMLRRARENGVTHLVATPHVVPGVTQFDPGLYRERLSQAQAIAAGMGLRVLPGSEIRFTDSTARLLEAGKIPTIADRKLLLLEFPPDTPFAHMEDAARTLANAGYALVFAHIERYDCLRRIRRIEYLRREYGVSMQVNASLFLRKISLFTRVWREGAMEADVIDLVASDAHNRTSRPCRLGECRASLTERYGRETADRLCVQTPGKLLGIL